MSAAAPPHPAALLPDVAPAFRTAAGAFYVADAAALLGALPAASVDAIVTSPPYPLCTPKPYPGPQTEAAWLDWFVPLTRAMRRVLRPDGSLVLILGPAYARGQPVRSLYAWRLLLACCDAGGFRLAQDWYACNATAIPAPAEWVCVRRVRLKDAVSYVWWLAPTPHPRADNRRVLVPYSRGMAALLRRPRRARVAPSGHTSRSHTWQDRGGAIPSNFLVYRDQAASAGAYYRRCRAAGVRPHPAPCPPSLVARIVGCVTAPGDLVVDPFAGSTTTGFVAEQLGRRWLAGDILPESVAQTRCRFGPDAVADSAGPALRCKRSSAISPPPAPRPVFG